MKAVTAAAFLALALLLACHSPNPDKYKLTDAQLGLTPEQALGRRLFDTYCLRCHESYTTEKRQAISLKGIYSKQWLPSGMPVNDVNMADVIVYGKRTMPATHLGHHDLQALLAYLHTL